MEWLFELKDINKIATEFWKNVGDKAKVFAFHGNMGAGKTTFIHALCDGLKVKEIVGSPTFSIINEYSFGQDGHEMIIYHIDLYRLKDENEAMQAGVEDCIYSGNYCFIEWPEKAPALLPETTVNVFIETIASSTRRLYIRQ